MQREKDPPPEVKREAFKEFWGMFVETNKKHGISHYPKKYYEELSSKLRAKDATLIDRCMSYLSGISVSFQWRGIFRGGISRKT